MIAAWMAYPMMISALIGLAAVAGEYPQRSGRRAGEGAGEPADRLHLAAKVAQQATLQRIRWVRQLGAPEQPLVYTDGVIQIFTKNAIRITGLKPMRERN